ncbi:MAG: hypothetical protein FWG19_00555, partial [Methanomassiliicoccaceae archaeon]|nr:hypothetical protein [Methanomassiliicoccaceae archaeon]
MGIGQEVLNVPFGEMIYQMASAIAQSQAELDAASVDVLAKMGDMENYPVSLPVWDANSGEETTIETSMIGAGFQPAFYQFTDAIIEVKMAVSMSHSSESNWSREDTTETNTESSSKSWWKRKSNKQTQCSTTTVNAGYTSKYSFKEEASSTLRVRLVPLPPNPIIQ